MFKFRDAYRAMRTTAEKRAFVAAKDDGVKMRAARSPRLIRDIYWDATRSSWYERCWKAFRQTQYKPH